MNKLQTVKLGSIADNFDNKRIPLSSAQRVGLEKVYPYYGAQGVIDQVDDYLFDGEYLLVAEDGENLKSQKQHICQIVTGKFWVNNHAHIIRAKPPHSTRYLNYLLNLLDLRPYITGSAQPKLTQENLQSIVLSLHAPAEQTRIAAVLSSLDAKIELNQRINVELEGLAKLLYDYWFVQYDFPMSAGQAEALGKPRLAGQPYRSSGGPMVYDPQLKREIPKGWRVGSLPDIATFTNGIACQKYPANGGDFLRVIKIREMGGGFTDESEKVTTDIPEKAVIRDGDVLFSWSASLEVMLWSGGTGALNQHIFKVTSETYPRSFYFFTLKNYLGHFKMMADLRKTTMGHITKEHLDQSRISIPPNEIASDFESKVAPLFQAIINNHQQNHELASLRDWLLPMLMNGQVRVG